MGAENELLNRKGKRVHRAFCFLSPLNKLVIFPGRASVTERDVGKARAHGVARDAEITRKIVF